MKTKGLTMENRRIVLAQKAEIRAMIKQSCGFYVGKVNRGVALCDFCKHVNVMSTHSAEDEASVMFGYKDVVALITLDKNTMELKLSKTCDVKNSVKGETIYSYNW